MIVCILANKYTVSRTEKECVGVRVYKIIQKVQIKEEENRVRKRSDAL